VPTNLSKTSNSDIFAKPSYNYIKYLQFQGLRFIGYSTVSTETEGQRPIHKLTISGRNKEMLPYQSIPSRPSSIIHSEKRLRGTKTPSRLSYFPSERSSFPIQDMGAGEVKKIVTL
jgi:hypothetical protein